ncbi:MAG: hypothetical protein II537_03595 [Bacteroidales bacterium]|nr:hypothetical protein [Bacteroidales bacterium]
MRKFFLGLFLLPVAAAGLCAKTPPSASRVETYRYASQLAPSAAYAVKVNGEDQFVYPTSEAQIVTFGCDGPVTVEVIPARSGFSSVAVRPLSKNYPLKKTAEGIRLSLSPYDRVSVEFDGDESCPLFIFANPLSGEKPSPEDPNVLFFEAGKVHPAGKIQLRQGQRLYIEGGAVVDGYVSASRLKGVSLDGFGILNAVPYTKEPNGIGILECGDVRVANLITCNTSGRMAFFYKNLGVEIDNLKCVGRFYSGEQTDAIDLYCNQDVRVTRCFCYGNDDTYCIKSQKFQFAGEVKHIRFDDCIAWNYRGNSFELGYETNLDVSDIRYTNIYSIHSSGPEIEYRRGAVTIHAAAAGTVSDISYENVFIEDPKEFGIMVWVLQSEYNIGNGVTYAPGVVKNVRFKNVRFLKAPRYGNLVMGFDTAHTAEVSFENLVVEGKKVRDDHGFHRAFCSLSFR